MAVSLHNIIETLYKFYSYIILLNISIAYHNDMASSCIYIFSHLFGRLRSSTVYELLNPFRDWSLRCCLHRKYKISLYAVKNKTKWAKLRGLGGHAIGSSLPMECFEKVWKSPSGEHEIADGNTAEFLKGVGAVRILSCANL